MTHITLDQISLSSAIKRAASVTDNKGSVAALQSVCFVAKDDVLELKSTNGKAWITCNVKEHSGNKSAFLVDGKKINEIVARFPQGCQLKIQHDEKLERVIISTKGKKYNIGCLPFDDFPQTTSMPQKATNFSLDATHLKKAINIVNIAVANDEARFYLNGMFWHVEDGLLKLVATDGHRLCLYKMPLPNVDFEGIIIPRDALQIIIRLLDGVDQINITMTDRFIELTGNDFAYRSLLIDGKYPDYQRVIPLNPTLQMDMNINATEAATRDVLVAVAGATANAVKYEVDGKQLIATNTQGEMQFGECRSVIDDGFKTDNPQTLKIAFVGKYMLDFISILNQEYEKSPKSKMRLSFDDSLSPAIVTHEKQADERDDNTLFILMPVRI